jgi:hypothetical protein
MAAQSRGSVNVEVQELNGSLDPTAMLAGDVGGPDPEAPDARRDVRLQERGAESLTRQVAARWPVCRLCEIKPILAFGQIQHGAVLK